MVPYYPVLSKVTRCVQSAEEMGTSQMLTCASFGCYGGGGATQNLFSLKNETKELIHELKVGVV